MNVATDLKRQRERVLKLDIKREGEKKRKRTKKINCDRRKRSTFHLRK